MEDITPPLAKKIPKELTAHGDVRVDDYFWMRLSDEQKNAEKSDEQTQDVLNYLNAENSYKESVMKDTENLQDELFKEMKGRMNKVRGTKTGCHKRQAVRTSARFEIHLPMPSFRSVGNVGNGEHSGSTHSTTNSCISRTKRRAAVW